MKILNISKEHAVYCPRHGCMVSVLHTCGYCNCFAELGPVVNHRYSTLGCSFENTRDKLGANLPRVFKTFGYSKSERIN